LQNFSDKNGIYNRGLQIRRPILFSFFVLLFLMACFCFPCHAGSEKRPVSLKNLLNKIEKKYSHRDFSVNFTQISTLKAINVVDKASGKAFFRYPGKMRWEYRTPEKNEIIADGKNLWIYRPSENQVVKGNAGDFFNGGAGGSFLSNISIIKKNYRLHIEKTDDSFIDLVMIPLKKIPDIASIHVRISRYNDEITRIITFNIYGDTTELNFTDIDFRNLDNSLFHFIVPEGVDILLMNK